MTEEEKKAIEYLKDYIKSDLNYFTIDFNNNLRISMNLIEKLQKDNEEKDKIREAKQYLEYYLIGNLKYENCQNEFKKILKLLEEVTK